MPTLAEELANDPLNLGYDPLVQSADDIAIAALLNATTGNGTGSVVVGEMTREALLLATLPAVVALNSKSDAVKERWDRYLAVLRSVTVIHITSPAVQALFALAVSDGLLTSEQASGIGQRTGSRAEVLWGVGTVITPAQIGAAR